MFVAIILTIVFLSITIVMTVEGVCTWWMPAMAAAVLGTFVITRFDVVHDCEKMGMFMVGGKVYTCVQIKENEQ